MKFSLLLCLLLLCPLVSSANVKDSLLRIWNNESLESSTRLDALSELTMKVFRLTNLDSGIYYSDLQYDFALKEKLPNYQADARLNKAFDLRLKGSPSLALEALNQSLIIYSKINDKQGVANVLNLTGSIYFEQESYDQSLKLLLQSAEIRESLGDKYDIATSYNTLGYWYDNDGDFAKALEYHYRSLKLRDEINDQKGLSWCYNNIAQVYFHQNRLDSSEYWYLKSIKLKQELNDYTLGITQGNLGMVYLASDRIDKAVAICQDGYLHAEEVGYSQGKLINCECLFKGYKAKKNWEEAFKYHETLVRLRENLKSTENAQALIEAELKYKFKVKEEVSKVDALRKIELAEERGENQQIIIYVITVAGLLLIIFLFQIFQSLKKSRKQGKLIALQKLVVTQRNREVMDSISYAKRIQNAILTPLTLVDKYLPDSFILYLPKDVVAGDFYWMEEKDGLIIFAVADCTGHGVPGALVSIVCSNALSSAVKEFGLTIPGEILNKTRELVIGQFEKSEVKVNDGMDISLCTYDPIKKALQWAGANNPIIIVSEGELSLIKGDKQPISAHPLPKPFTTHYHALRPNDCIYLFTDGYVDQFGGENNKKFKQSALSALISENSIKPMEEQEEVYKKAIMDWKGSEEQIDDICLLGFRVSE